MDAESRLVKIFGIGPLGLLLSAALLGLAWLFDKWLGWPRITTSEELRRWVLLITVAINGAIVVWSMITLRPSERGEKLCTRGPFRWMRHPLYGAFLSCGCWGLAFFFNSWVYFLWSASLHPLWHYLIRKEEYLVIGVFGDEYRRYASRTGRFFPRFWQTSGRP